MSASKTRSFRDYFFCLLYRAIYNLLNLLHYLCPPPSLPLRPTTSPVKIPPHVAFSGPLSQDIPSVAHLAHLAISHGASHITLYDPWGPLTISTLLKALQHHPNIPPCLIKELHPDGSEIYLRHPPQQLPLALQLPTSNTSTTTFHTSPIITVVHPGAGRGALVRAARAVAVEQAGMNVDQITAWLDASEGMLPSEPDVVVVFRDKGMGNVLYGFPIWQLRLTQIRFSPRPVSELDESTLLAMIASAATAPKRFGR